MKFDMELVRALLLWCEDHIPDKTKAYLASDIDFKGYSKDQIFYHVTLLNDAGYLKIRDLSAWGDGDCVIDRMTFDGTQFLEGIKSDTVWNGVKEEAEKIGIKVFISAIPVILQIIAKHAGL